MKHGSRIFSILFAAFLSLFFLFSCNGDQKQSSGKIKNIILLIGDGMGPPQMGIASLFAKHSRTGRISGGSLWMNRIIEDGQMGFAYPYASDSLTIDSAASASQIATGKPSGSEMIGLDRSGEPAKTVLELAKEYGMATGLVSNTRLTHATPAAFAAHVAHRSQENEIAEQMIRTGPDVMLSGGLRHFLPASVNDQNSALHQEFQQLTDNSVALKSKRDDDQNLILDAQKAGYRTVFTRSQLRNIQNGKTLGLFSESGMPDAIREERSKNDPRRSVPTLLEMTESAVKILSRDPEGFFLMVEGGQIDWAAHNNDAGTMLHEMIRFDEVVGYAYRWAKNRNDTLVLVTADHETGLPGFSYGKVNVPSAKKLSGSAFRNRSYQPNYNFVPADHVDRLYRQKKSFYDIAMEFESLPDRQKTAASLRNIINRNLAYTINLEEAKFILAKGMPGESSHKHDQNDGHLEDHEYLKPFYPYSDGSINHRHLVEVLSPKQMVVWATGTHSSSPVSVIAYGPEQDARLFSRSFISNAEFGELLQRIVRDHENR